MKSNCITSASHPPLLIFRQCSTYFAKDCSQVFFPSTYNYLLFERLSMAAPATPFLWKSVRRLRNATAPRKLGNATINPLSPPLLLWNLFADSPF